MGDDRTRPEDETQKKAQGADQAAAPDEPATAATPATARADANSGRMQVGAAVPCLEVRLSPEAEEADEAIAERALQALFSGAPLRRERILMRTARGRVTLSGSVGTEAERAAAERLVGGVEGVVEVANLVVVERHGRTTGSARNVAEAYGGDAESGDLAGRVEAVLQPVLKVIGPAKPQLTGDDWECI